VGDGAAHRHQSYKKPSFYYAMENRNIVYAGSHFAVNNPNAKLGFYLSIMGEEEYTSSNSPQGETKRPAQTSLNGNPAFKKYA
jgi:hypothetical protein